MTPDDFKQRFENGHPAVWGAIDMDVDGLKKEERNTVIVNVECEYSKYNEEGKLIRQKESVAVAYDVIADKNGNAKINRAGLINAITSQDKIEEGDIDISVGISTRPGSPGDNYPNNIEKVEWSEYQEPAPRPITDYASTHASTGAYPTSSTPRDKDGNISVTGGKIKNYTPSPEEKQVYSTKVKITVNQETAKKRSV